jgi:hypothetical protein
MLMKRVLWISVLLLALTLVASTGTVAIASNSNLPDEDPGSDPPPTVIVNGGRTGDDNGDTEGDPDDYIGGNKTVEDNDSTGDGEGFNGSLDRVIWDLISDLARVWLWLTP